MWSVPSQPVLGGEFVAGIQYQVEIIRQLLVSQELFRLSPQFLGRTRVDHHHAGAGIGERL